VANTPPEHVAVRALVRLGTSRVHALATGSALLPALRDHAGGGKSIAIYQADLMPFADIVGEHAYTGVCMGTLTPTQLEGSDTILVHDPVHLRGSDGWLLRIRAYPKLTLPIAWIGEQLSSARLKPIFA
jgi:hypothetical protein